VSSVSTAQDGGSHGHEHKDAVLWDVTVCGLPDR
jgi:hypothetical protein